MDTLDIDRLIAMLNPECDEETLTFVKSTLVTALSSRGISDTNQSRSDQQKVDIFESPLFNDPRNW
jgi:hypothetical protein